jgi:hypothetical protein
MSAATAAATTAAIAAAAEQQRRLREEEEEMTPYSQLDLSQDWEFKILRSCRAAFRQPEELRKYLDEEARAGWVLVEKFDDTRLRLKRPAAARERDGKLDFDPYRTTIGPSPNAVALATLLIAVAIAVGILLAVAGVAAALS